MKIVGNAELATRMSGGGLVVKSGASPGPDEAAIGMAPGRDCAPLTRTTVTTCVSVTGKNRGENTFFIMRITRCKWGYGFSFGRQVSPGQVYPRFWSDPVPAAIASSTIPGSTIQIFNVCQPEFPMAWTLVVSAALRKTFSCQSRSVSLKDTGNETICGS